MCLEAIPYFAFNLSNIIKSVYGKNKKAAVLDLDNTLWGGVIGDDGQEEIEIGHETSVGQVYSEFQSYLKEIKSWGVMPVSYTHLQVLIQYRQNALRLFPAL